MTENFGAKNIKNKHPDKVKQKKKENTKRDHPTMTGLSDDGLILYDGYGDYKKLCPICKKAFMNKRAQMCRSCWSEMGKKPKIPKEVLYKAIEETDNYNEVARMFNRDKKEIVKWYKYYALEDRNNGVTSFEDKNIPARDVLKNDIREHTFKEVGEKYGVGERKIKKWCVRYCLPTSEIDIKNMNALDWANV